MACRPYIRLFNKHLEKVILSERPCRTNRGPFNYECILDAPEKLPDYFVFQNSNLAKMDENNFLSNTKQELDIQTSP